MPIRTPRYSNRSMCPQEPPQLFSKLHHVSLRLLCFPILHRRRDNHGLLCRPPWLLSRARALLCPKIEPLLFHSRYPLARLCGLHLWHFDQHSRVRGRNWETGARRRDVSLQIEFLLWVFGCGRNILDLVSLFPDSCHEFEMDGSWRRGGGRFVRR